MLYNPQRQQQLEKWKERREEIRSLYAAGMPVADLSEKYKVSRSRIYQIIGGIKKNGKASKQKAGNGPAPPS